MPIGLGTAVIGSAVVGAGASIYGASKAAGAANSAAAANNALQREIYDKNYAMLSPYVGYGTAAGNEMMGLLNLGGDPAAAAKAFDTYKNSTGYQTTLAAGTDALNTGAANRGLLASGANLKNISNYGQQQNQQYLNNYLQQLVGQQGIGMSAGSAVAGVGQNYANAVGANNNSAASATGNAYLSGAGSINNLLGQLTGTMAYGKGASSYGGGSSGGIPVGTSGWGVT